MLRGPIKSYRLKHSAMVNLSLESLFFSRQASSPIFSLYNSVRCCRCSFSRLFRPVFFQIPFVSALSIVASNSLFSVVFFESNAFNITGIHTSTVTIEGSNDINVTIHQSIFANCTSTTHGGAISISTQSYENSSVSFFEVSFFSCGSSKYGGAIFINNLAIEMTFVCAVGCKASFGNFAYIVSDRLVSNATSVLQCSKNNRSTSSGWEIGGNSGSIVNSNFSLNMALSGSALFIKAARTQLSRSSILNNTGLTILDLRCLTGGQSVISEVQAKSNRGHTLGLLKAAGRYLCLNLIFVKNDYQLISVSNGSSLNIYSAAFDREVNMSDSFEVGKAAFFGKPNVTVGFVNFISYTACVQQSTDVFQRAYGMKLAIYFFSAGFVLSAAVSVFGIMRNMKEYRSQMIEPMMKLRNGLF